MAQLKTNTFTSYEFTDQELLEACAFNPYQKLYLQSRRAEIAEQKLALVFEPAKPMEFMQQNAYLTGQMDILNFLLDHEDTIKESAKAELEAQQQQS